MSDSMNRRDIIGLSLAGVATVGLGASLFAMKRTWDILPSVKAAGFTTIDLSPMQAGEIKTVEWRGKPVYILKKTADMAKCADRDVPVGGADYSVGLQICTHLGCIPSWNAEGKIFKCACHGGEFDACGKQTFGPPPRPMDIPPFKIDGTKLVLGEEGPEYLKLTGKA